MIEKIGDWIKILATLVFVGYVLYFASTRIYQAFSSKETQQVSSKVTKQASSTNTNTNTNTNTDTRTSRQTHSIDEWANILPRMTKDQVVDLLGKPNNFAQQTNQELGYIIWERFTYNNAVVSQYSSTPDTLYVDFQYDKARSLTTGSGQIVQLF